MIVAKLFLYLGREEPKNFDFSANNVTSPKYLRNRTMVMIVSRIVPVKTADSNRFCEEHGDQPDEVLTEAFSFILITYAYSIK